jgi:probable rRNA maturation factor
VTFLVINQQRKHTINRREVQTFLRDVTRSLDIAHREFSVVFIGDEKMREYNHTYRGFDKPTDVLSFSGDNTYLGDILISAETAYNQARRSRTLSFESNLHRLMLHGLLHLMGYDHETDDGEMRAIERRYRRKFQC